MAHNGKSIEAERLGAGNYALDQVSAVLIQYHVGGRAFCRKSNSPDFEGIKS